MRIGFSAARWQSGDAEDCKSSYTGSIPVRASNLSIRFPSALVPFLVCVCVLALSAFVPTPSRAADGLPPGMVEQSILVRGEKRVFLMFDGRAPAAGDAKAAMVIDLHGGGQSMWKAFEQPQSPHRRWLSLARQHGFILLAPNGTDPRTGLSIAQTQHWNDFRLDWPGRTFPPDDTAFLVALAEWGVRSQNADPARIYLTGASNGGMMTFRGLIERPDVFAAAAAFIAVLPDRELPVPAAARPIFLLNGTADPVVPWNGRWLGRDLLGSTADTLSYWLDIHGLSAPGAITQIDEIGQGSGSEAPDCSTSEWVFGGTADAPLVRMVALRGGGHWLPSTWEWEPVPQLLEWLGPKCETIDGPLLAWEFLRNHRLALEKGK